MKNRILLIFSMLLINPLFAKQPKEQSAESILNQFLNTKTMQVDFEQTTFSGKKVRTSYGNMQISRPNKFRWEYTKKGDEQVVTSDGKKIYIYDKPLAQVTVRKFDQSIDKSPATLLAGGNNVNALYSVSKINSKTESLNWIKLLPKKEDENNGFKQVVMGFDQNNQLSRMNFLDNFDNKTQIKFSSWKMGTKFAESEFNFTVPKGVDVIEE